MWIEASGGGGGTQITPSDATPVALVNGETYEAGGNGYAIGTNPNDNQITPTVNGASFTSGIKKMLAGGYAYDRQMYKGDFSEAARDSSSATTNHTLTGLAGKKLLMLLFQFSTQTTLAYNRLDGATCDDGSTITKVCNLLTSNANATGTFYEVEVATNTCKITTQNNSRLVALGIE